MSCPCRDFHTIPSSRCWDGVHELPGLAPPAAGVSAWGVTLFLSFLLDPRKCPIAGHLHGAVSLLLALPLIFGVFWLNHPVWQGSPERTASVPVSLSPLALALSLPSWLSPAHRARCPPALPAVSSALDFTPVPGAFSLPQLPKEPCPAQRSEQFLQVWGAGKETQGGRSGAGSHPCPRDEREPPGTAQGPARGGGSRRRERRKNAGNREKVGK